MFRPRPLVLAAALVAAALPTAAADGPTKGVKKVSAAFEPAEAKPGQTVTLAITVDLLDGYHTYPTSQPEKLAADLVNKIAFPAPGAVVFVGGTIDPPNPKSKPEPALGIADERYYEGTVVYRRKAVVSPTAAPGAVSVELPPLRLSICDKNNCFLPKPIPVAAALKVLAGPAVPVDPAYAAEVAKAAGGK